jgi:hypothetical protein
LLKFQKKTRMHEAKMDRGTELDQHARTGHNTARGGSERDSTSKTKSKGDARRRGTRTERLRQRLAAAKGKRRKRTSSKQREIVLGERQQEGNQLWDTVDGRRRAPTDSSVPTPNSKRAGSCVVGSDQRSLSVYHQLRSTSANLGVYRKEEKKTKRNQKLGTAVDQKQKEKKQRTPQKKWNSE